jgi:hypothetical protein
MLALLSAVALWGASNGPSTEGRMLFLDLRGGRVASANADGSDVKVLQTGLRQGPDGAAVDATSRHIFWSNMGKVKLDGIALDLKGQRMFFPDLGGNVYSANLDGTDKKVLLTGQGTLTGIAYAELPTPAQTR